VEGLECARVRVPLDWDRPKGRTIALAVIRHLASKPEQEKHPSRIALVGADCAVHGQRPSCV
jgi:hypothetical protein